MTMKGSTKIVNFMTDRAGILMLGCDHIRHYSKYALFSTLINKQHIICYCIKELQYSFPMPLLIFIYLMIGLLIYKYEPFFQEFSAVSDIQVTVRPVGLLLQIRNIQFSKRS